MVDGQIDSDKVEADAIHLHRQWLYDERTEKA
jgi:hypothetical protein